MYKLIFLFPAVLLIVLGWLMLKFKMVEMIAGYDPKKVTDKDGMAKWVGTNLLLMGLLSLFITAIGYAFSFISMVALTIIFISIIIILCIRTALGTGKYESK